MTMMINSDYQVDHIWTQLRENIWTWKDTPESGWQFRNKQIQAFAFAFACLSLCLVGKFIYSACGIMYLMHLLLPWLLPPSFTGIRTQLFRLSNVNWWHVAVQESDSPLAPDLDCWGPQLCGHSIYWFLAPPVRRQPLLLLHILHENVLMQHHVKCNE